MTAPAPVEQASETAAQAVNGGFKMGAEVLGDIGLDGLLESLPFVVDVATGGVL